MEEILETSPVIENTVNQDNSEDIVINQNKANLKRKLEDEEETTPKLLKSADEYIEDDENDDGAFCTIVSITCNFVA